MTKDPKFVASAISSLVSISAYANQLSKEIDEEFIRSSGNDLLLPKIKKLAQLFGWDLSNSETSETQENQHHIHVKTFIHDFAVIDGYVNEWLNNHDVKVMNIDSQFIHISSTYVTTDRVMVSITYTD